MVDGFLRKMADSFLNPDEQQYNDDENRRVYPASEDPYGDPADQGQFGQFGNVRPASEDPYGDPADYGQYGQFGNVRPASEDPYGDPADEENRWA
ncbi:Translation initiation factor [Planktothrix tepida]|uniref:Translation initiation factor n=2 Tax=Planktothrix TaxID=54304 RepID=A0A1J1LS33_9CYAN